MSINSSRSVIILLISILVFTACEPKIRSWKLYSPNENISIVLTHERLIEEKKSRLSYQVFHFTDSSEVEIVESSLLGISRLDGSFTDNLKFHSESDETEYSGSYELIAGKHKNISYSGNELIVTFQNDSGQYLAIDLRASNDGVAFRYRFPEIDSMKFTVTGESTSFKIPFPGSAWMQAYDTITRYTPSYETFFNSIPIGSNAPGSQGWSFPALFKINGTWALITEANLNKQFYGAHLQPVVREGNYVIRLPESEEAYDTGVSEPTATLPWTMPWRVIMIGAELSTIVESTLVQDLSAPSIVEDLSWIKSGRASWSWWSDHDSPKKYEELVKFVDLAEEMSWEYSLVDANWNMMKGGDLEALVEYANGKNVGILLWYNSGGPHNIVTEQVRDVMHLREKRRQEFEKLQKWGVKGVKIDFFQSDKPHIIRQYHEILQDAKDFQILVNFHGCTLPRGWDRTYPHLVSMESVRGAEYYSFDPKYPELAPKYNTILPYTRNTIGSMDYTPVAFSDQVYPHITTYGHEIGLSVVFQSGILHFADRVSIYQELPQFAKSYLTDIPAAWDQTKFIDGYPGQYVVLAREKDGIWYFGGINGTDKEIKIELKLPFIDEGTYLAEIITDGEKNRSFMSYKKPYNNTSSLTISMKSYGGFAGRLIDFEKIEE